MELVARLPPHLEQTEPSDPQSVARDVDPGDFLTDEEYEKYDHKDDDYSRQGSPAEPRFPAADSLLRAVQSSANDESSLEREYLIVNQAQVVRRNCLSCGGPLARKTGGETVLVARLNEPDKFLFCLACGNNIMSHASERGAQSYAWDWAFLLR